MLPPAAAAPASRQPCRLTCAPPRPPSSQPFFGDICSLIGALTFFPLAIWFPFRMYHRVYKPTGFALRAMIVVGFVMFLICIGSTLGAVRGIINNWSSYQFFAS